MRHAGRRVLQHAQQGVEAMSETTGGLVMPKNPARALQELHRKQMEQPPGSAEDTADDTAISTASSTAVSTDVLPSSSDAIQEDGQQSVRPSVSQEGGKGGRPSVRDKIQSRVVREPTVRITIDVPETLHARLKEYCLTHRVESLRVLTLALYEEFLSEEE